MSAAVPVVADLFVMSGDGDASLVASRCAGCGTHLFPAGDRCPDPSCPGGGMEPQEIGRRGRLYSWTEQAYQPPLFGMDPWHPYVIGVVELEEGLRVMAMIVGEPSALEFDREMELVTVPLRRDESGDEVVTYAYRPA